MQPTISLEVFATIQAIALSQACQLTLAQSLAQLGFAAAASRLPPHIIKMLDTRLTEREARKMVSLLSGGCAVLAIAEAWKEIKFVDGGAIAPSQIEFS